jgi:hypothetical protein
VQVEYSQDVVNRHSEINLTNIGDSRLGSLCLNVYSFTTDEKLIGCCSCKNWNGRINLQVDNDLLHHIPADKRPNTLIIRTMNSIDGSGSCRNSAALAGTLRSPIVPGRLTFATTLDTKETPFQRATFSAAEQANPPLLFCGWMGGPVDP